MAGTVASGVDRLERKLLFGLQPAPERTFQALDDNAKVEMLKLQFEKLMIAAAVNLSGNLRCPYHDDVVPSLRYYPDTKRFFCYARCFHDH